MRVIVAHAPPWVLAASFAVAAIAVNVIIGMGAAVGHRPMLLALALGLLPALLIAFGTLVEAHRAVLAWIALALSLTGVPVFGQPLPIPGGAPIVLADLLLLLAIGAWLGSRLTRVPPRHPVQLSRAFGWPLGLLAIAIVGGVLVGYERYGASILGQPLRVALYAGIALALTDVSVAAAWRGITVVFYAGAIVQSLWAAYYLATGGSQTQSDILTTGGVRVLALSVAMFLTGSLVCALLNLELETRPGRQLLHAGVAALALFGIVISFGRTTYAAVVLIVPLLLATRRYLRRTLLWILPLFVPALLVVALLASPKFVATIEARLGGTSRDDGAVVWREKALGAALEGVEDAWLTGVGFGRNTEFVMDGQVVKIEGDPHNSYAWLLAGGGVFALGAFLLVCGTFLLDSLRRVRRATGVDATLIVWTLATWLCFMVNALTGPVLSDPEMLMSLWVLMALPSVVAANAAR